MTSRLPRLLLALLALTGPGAVLAGPAGEALPPLTPADAERVMAEVRADGAEVVLVNVWATWCAPCLEELPDLLRLREDYADRGLRLLLVSADFASASRQVRERLAGLGVTFETFLRSGDDMAFIEAFSEEWSGALPASFVYDRTGRLRHVELGQASYAEFEELVTDVLRGDSPRARKEMP